MGLDYANAGQMPNAPDHYSQQQQRQMIRVLELYFSLLDSDMPQHCDQYTAKRFIGGDFHGGRFFGDGAYLETPFQRFESLSNQNATAVDQAFLVQFDPPAFPSTITLVGATRITLPVAGVYRIDYGIQFNSASSGTEVVQTWLRRNGVDIVNSNSRFAVPSKVGGAFPAVTMCQRSFFRTFAAGDYFEVVWSPDATAISMRAFPALAATPGVNPAIPATPSAVLLVSLVQADLPIDAVLKLPRRLRPP